MTIKVITNDDSAAFTNSLLAIVWSEYPSITTESYNEDNYKEKKKAIMIKASCGTRLTPFVAVYNEDKDLVKAFYSEVGECTLNSIIKYLKCQEY